MGQLVNTTLSAAGNSSSSGATTSAFAGSGPPTTQVPLGNAGTYWDITNKIQYQWNPNTSSWEQ